MTFGDWWFGSFLYLADFGDLQFTIEEVEQCPHHSKRTEEWLQAPVSMCTNVFFACSVLLMCPGLVQNREINFIIGLTSIKSAQQLPMVGIELGSFILQARAYTTGTLHQPAAHLLMGGTQSKEQLFSNRCDIIWVSIGLQVQNIQKEDVSGQVHNKTQPSALICANSPRYCLWMVVSC